MSGRGGREVGSYTAVPGDPNTCSGDASSQRALPPLPPPHPVVQAPGSPSVACHFSQHNIFPTLKQEGGRGRATPGRGGRGGRFGTPPPPPPGGRTGRGFAPGRGRGPSAFYGGGGGRGGPGLGYSPSPHRPGRGQTQLQRGSPGAAAANPVAAGPFVKGRGPGRGTGAAPAGGSAGGYAVAHSGVGGGRLFGRGQEAVAYDREKEKGVLKVGPPPGQRFSATWLRGLTHFVAWRQQQQAQEAARQPQQRQRQQQQQPVAAPPPPPPPAADRGQQLGEGQASSAGAGEHPAARPRVTVERLDAHASSSSAFDEAAAAAELAEQLAEQLGEISFAEGAQGSTQPGVEAASAAAGPALSPESSCMGGGDSDLNEEADLLAAGRSGASTPASTSGGGEEDLGWASVLLPAAAAAAASPSQGSGGEEQQAAWGKGSPGQEPPSAGSPSSPAAAAGEGDDSEHGGEPGRPGSRHWWPPSPPSLASAQPVAVEERPAEPTSAAAGGGRVALSLRLERMSLTDREAGMLADWCCEQSDAVDVQKLWLFDNRLGDEGAAALARILQAHPGMLEIHLSHNMLTLRGANALLEALPVHGGPAAAEPAAGAAAGAAAVETSDSAGEQQEAGEAAAPAAELPSRPVWLRLEWNRISLGGLMQALEEQHTRRGLLVDLPTAVRPDAAPSLPDLPPYLAAAAATSPAAPTSAPASRGARNALQFVVDRCHARLPWISCQYQQPSEASVLKAARSTWRAAQQAQQQEDHDQPTAEPGSSEAGEAAADAAAPSAAQPTNAARGPLLLFPDTSALLPMLGAGERVSLPTFFTLELLEGLAKAGRFGRALPPQDQVFLVVTDSVLKQLDGLKNDPAARPAVRRFLGQFLDLCGPAGHDFLTVLGAHEGEGLLVEHDAAVAGSRSADTKGQRADHRIVEVALFFQQEVAGRASRLTATAFPVLLLSGDNTQVQTARSHGLPAARMADLGAAQARLEAALAGGQLLTASLLRACLGGAAVTGLGAVAARSLQAEFDEAVAALQLATDALVAGRQQLAAVAAAAAACEGSAEEALAAVRQALGGVASSSSGGSGTADELLPALRARLAEWQQRVVSHQDPSRLLRWASGTPAGGSSTGGTHAGGGIASGGSAAGSTEGGSAAS